MVEDSMHMRKSAGRINVL